MPNKTISVPEDVVPIIESLDIPFSRWVTEQLRRHAAASTMSFADQIEADSRLVGDDGGERPDPARLGAKLDRSAPW